MAHHCPSFNHINWFLHILLLLMLPLLSLSLSLGSLNLLLLLSAPPLNSTPFHMILSPPSLSQLFLSKMRNPSLLRREFLKKWMMGLQILNNATCSSMTVSDRKKAIKLSADIALASSANCATRWSRALIAAAAGRAKQSSSKKILKRSRRVWRRRAAAAAKKCRNLTAESIAKRLVEKRTKVLRGLVPGGEFMDEISLIEETLDYMSALQAQVDVMRCLANAYVPSIHHH